VTVLAPLPVILIIMLSFKGNYVIQFRTIYNLEFFQRKILYV
jgi:hypothetical protein